MERVSASIYEFRDLQILPAETCKNPSLLNYFQLAHTGNKSMDFIYEWYTTFYLIVEVLLRETAQKMSVWEKVFWVIKEIFYDSEKSFMTQKTFSKSVEKSFEKINSE